MVAATITSDKWYMKYVHTGCKHLGCQARGWCRMSSEQLRFIGFTYKYDAQGYPIPVPPPYWQDYINLKRRERGLEVVETKVKLSTKPVADESDDSESEEDMFSLFGDDDEDEKPKKKKEPESGSDSDSDGGMMSMFD